MSLVAERDPRQLSAEVDWQTVARLVLTSRAMDRVEEERLVPEKKVLYQFSARGHDMAQVLLGLQLRDGALASGALPAAAQSKEKISIWAWGEASIGIRESVEKAF